jgi:hypothetical protein
MRRNFDFALISADPDVFKPLYESEHAVNCPQERKKRVKIDVY